MLDNQVPPLLNAIERQFPGLTVQFPVSKILDNFATLPIYSRYQSAPDLLQEWHSRIADTFGECAVYSYNKLLLMSCINLCRQRGEIGIFPDDIRVLFEEYFARIENTAVTNSDDYYSFGNDRYLKDLAIARRKLVPCGAQLVDVQSGISRRSVLAGGLKQALIYLHFVVRRLGGFKPLYQLHMDLRLLFEFNPAGWERCFRRIARMLAVDPDIRGVFGVSWWFDPQLESVSPRIGFLREMPMRNGAAVFNMGENQEAKAMALARSKERQDAFAQGYYRPRTYLLIWPRTALLDWAGQS